MRVNLLLVVFAISMASTAQAQVKTASATTVRRPVHSAVRVDPGMTNAAVIRMVRAKLSDDVVINAIASATKKSFDITPDGLVALKGAGVSDRVIRAMQGNPAVEPAVTRTKSEEPAPKPEKAVDKTPATVTRAPGIYAVAAGNYTKLVSVDAKTEAKGGGLAGFGKSFIGKGTKTQAVVNGKQAKMRLSSDSAFYFYFDKEDGIGEPVSAFQILVSNPNEFVLARLDAESKNRTLVIMEAGGFTSITGKGISDKDKVDFKVEKIGSGVYKVTPATKLEPGEYAFLYGNQVPVPNAKAKLFDFGVDR